MANGNGLLSSTQQVALSPEEEARFQQWYKAKANQYGLILNPDSQPYDYRAAFLAGADAEVSPIDGLPHWPSEFKLEGHPNRIVDGVDTRYAKPPGQEEKIMHQGRPHFDPRTPLPQSVISAAEQWGQSPEAQMDPLLRQQEMNRQRAMAGDLNYASIGPREFQHSGPGRILDNIRYVVPRAVGDAFKGGTAGTVAGVTRIAQALIPGEQPRMAEFEQYVSDQIPESRIGKAAGFVGSFAPEFTLAGDVADLGRVPGYLREGDK